MIAATLTLRPVHTWVPTPSAEVIVDVFWAHTLQSDRIEHIRVRAGPHDIAICFFIRTADHVVADEFIKSIVARIRHLPALQDWLHT